MDPAEYEAYQAALHQYSATHSHHPAAGKPRDQQTQSQVPATGTRQPTKARLGDVQLFPSSQAPTGDSDERFGPEKDESESQSSWEPADDDAREEDPGPASPDLGQPSTTARAPAVQHGLKSGASPKPHVAFQDDQASQLQPTAEFTPKPEDRVVSQPGPAPGPAPGPESVARARAGQTPQVNLQARVTNHPGAVPALPSSHGTYQSSGTQTLKPRPPESDKQRETRQLGGQQLVSQQSSEVETPEDLPQQNLVVIQPPPEDQSSIASKGSEGSFWFWKSRKSGKSQKHAKGKEPMGQLCPETAEGRASSESQRSSSSQGSAHSRPPIDPSPSEEKQLPEINSRGTGELQASPGPEKPEQESGQLSEHGVSATDSAPEQNVPAKDPGRSKSPGKRKNRSRVAAVADVCSATPRPKVANKTLKAGDAPLQKDPEPPLSIDPDMTLPPSCPDDQPPSGPEPQPNADQDNQTAQTAPEIKQQPQDTPVNTGTDLRRRVCLDYRMHSVESHAAIHHPGLLRGADFCDAGVEDAPEVEISLPDKTWEMWPFWDRPQEEETEPIIGRRFRLLLGGDICTERVDVSAHRHKGHSHAVKVRPAAGVPAFIDKPHHGHANESKVKVLNQFPVAFHYPEAIRRLPSSPAISIPGGTFVDPGPIRRISQLGGMYDGPSDSEDQGFSGARRLTAISRSIFHNHSTHEGHSSESKVRGIILDPPPGEPGSVEVELSDTCPTSVRSSSAVSSHQEGPPPNGKFQGEVHETAREPLEHGNARARVADFPSYESLGRNFSSYPASAHVPMHREPVPETQRAAHGAHHGHSMLSKVQPYGRFNLSDDTDTASLSSYPASPHHFDDDPPPAGPKKTAKAGSKVDAYWGSLPPTGIKSKGKMAETIVPGVDTAAESDPSTNVGPSQEDAFGGRSFVYGKTEIRRPSWFRDLVKSPEPYTTRLTELPPKKLTPEALNRARSVEQLRPRKTTSFSRPLTRQSTASSTLDSKFKKAFHNLESLLSETLNLASAVVDNVEEDLPKGTHQSFVSPGKQPANARPLTPIVDESTHGGDDDSFNELPVQHDDDDGQVPGQTSSRRRHGPKHYQSSPNMVERRSDLLVDIPERNSSLVNGGVYHSRGILLVSQRDSFRDDQRASLPRHTLKKERSSPLPRATRNSQGRNQSVSESNDTAMDRVVRKLKSVQVLPRGTGTRRGGSRTDRPPGVVADNDPPQRPDKVRLAAKTAHGGRRSYNAVIDGGDGVADDELDWSSPSRRPPLSGGVDGSRRGDSARALLSPQDALPAAERDGDPVRARPSFRINLRGKAHVSIRGDQGFSLGQTNPRQPVARDWSPGRKRFVASVACISTAVIGILIGIYAGLVPSIQYWIADFHHYAILGNVVFYLGLAVPTFFFWPLPLLHGRKPYILSSLAIAMPLLFPQAIAVSAMRSPYTSVWRWSLLCSRALMGLTLGFASMNFHSILTDVFGASLMSSAPHQEVVDKFDVRRHGGGMGVWLGIWTWCFTGSLAVGFLIGAVVINSLNPSWGFYISIILIAVVLLLNVICPEVRRSAFRRSVAEVRSGHQVSRRVARGEVMMHRVKDGPTWWGQEVQHGILLSMELLRQPGFLVIAVYTGWIYAQVVLIIVLLGSLTSKYYMLHSPFVGLCVSFVAIGALVAVPFQKANIFSRGRTNEALSDDQTMLNTEILWTSHLVRRAVFCIVLPLAGVAYTVASHGPPVPVAIPTLFAAVIAILSGLAMSECNGLIMETFDTSDLQPGMTGRRRGDTNGIHKRTNYSSYPRVTAGMAVCQTFGFVLAAVATGVGGALQRHMGQRAATGVVAGILLILTLLLLGVLIRFKEVQIIPTSKTVDMEKWEQIRRESVARRRSLAASGSGATPMLSSTTLTAQSGPPTTTNTSGTLGGMTEEELLWRPIIIGNPSSKMRRVNVLELGAMTRWTAIRMKNRLIDERTAHLNRAALEAAHEATGELVRSISDRARGNRTSRARLAATAAVRRYHSTNSSLTTVTSPSGHYKFGGGSGGGGSGGGDGGEEIEMDVVEAMRPGSAEHGAPPHHGHFYGRVPPAAAAARAGTGAAAVAGTLPSHHQTRGAGEGFSERECVMGQTVREEDEGSRDVEDPESDFLSSEDEHGYGLQREIGGGSGGLVSTASRAQGALDLSSSGVSSGRDSEGHY